MSRRGVAGVRRDWGTDETGCTVLHVDMDAFFASVELARRPELRGRPVVVGGDGRSVVLAATYEARAYGIHSAMPMARALRLCPQVVVVPPDQAAYRAASAVAMGVMRQATPVVEQVSVDEAFLDVAGSRRRIGTPTEVASAIRAQVREELGVTCSVGIAATKFVAKLASGFAKPDGVMLVPQGSTVPFLHSLPVGALWGVGERTQEALGRWGITTVAALAASDVATVQRAVGAAAGAHLHALAWGHDPREVTPERQEKSVGAEVTLERDTSDRAQLDGHLLALADRCGRQLRARGLVARTIVLKVRTEDFRTRTRSHTCEVPTDVGQEMHVVARALLEQTDLEGRRVRLVGVRAEGLLPATVRQPTLDEASSVDGHAARRRVEGVMDEVRGRFGDAAVRPGALLARGTSRRARDARASTTAPGRGDLS